MDKKVLIYENTELLNTILSDLKHFQPALKEFKKAFESLEIGTFYNDVFTEIKAHGISSTLMDYQKSLETQLEKAGVTNSKLRAIILQGSEEPIANLKTAYSNLKGVVVHPNQYAAYRTKVLELSEISFKDGVFQVVNTEELTENYCRVYLNDSQDREMYKTLENTKKALNEFAEMAKRLGFPFGIADSGLHEFFDLVEGKLIIKPYSINDARNYLPQRQAIHDAALLRQEKQSAFEQAARKRAGIV